MGGGNSEEGGKKNVMNVSHSERSGLKFPVGRIHRYLKTRKTSKARVGATAAVYIAPVLEYLTAEVMEIAVIMDMLVKATIAGGGVMQHIHKFLLKTKGKETSKKAEGNK